MSQHRIRARRVAAYHKQNGLCFYCAKPMWEMSLETKAEARLRFGIVEGSPGSKKALKHIACTAEHLKRVAEGGTDARRNIVAACAKCNVCRNDAAPAVHQAAMREVAA